MSATAGVRRALIAVSDKAGVVEFAGALSRLDWAIVSSGGTAAAIRAAGIDVTAVSDVTGSPEMFGGRVKTLHPRIHGGILADRRDPGHVRELEEHGIAPFDLVVVNLYPFGDAVASGAPTRDVLENIDIGGPAMVRAAAKNFESVGVVVRPDRYDEVIAELRRDGGLSLQTRRRLAAEAFAHTAAYDVAIANWFAARGVGRGPGAWDGDPPDPAGLPPFLGIALERDRDLRYGENPHQAGALYRRSGGPAPLDGAEVLQGKEMSYNNWLDADAARDLAFELAGPACVIVKHNNPCGVALGATVAEAYRRAFASDSVSAFGGVVAFNAPVDADAVAAMAGVFTEVVIAPAYGDDALAALGGRENLRVLRSPAPSPDGLGVRPIHGGALVQTRDDLVETRAEMKVVSAREPSEREWDDLVFAWTVAARVRSNAIVLAADGATVGIGAGQMSRVDAAWLAVRKAGRRARGAVMASDAFFPFADAVEAAAEAGAAAVIHPGGSVRDDEVLEAAERHGMAVVVTGRRHFRH
jgi:phosphoribosylaminoimidazolecarboxamide formyltransferase / IMP cyclohydrolase